MSSQNENKKEEGTKARFHGLALSNQGRGIKSQSIAFQNSKWSNINRRSGNSGFDDQNVPGMTTVYVGKIPPQISDVNIRKLLNECGNIMRWNRSEDPTTKQLSSFGLCEFDSPEGVINAVSVLNGLKIFGSQLLVKYQHGIDKLIAKWRSNRINEMLKQRGGDCTIETILNELSTSDSKLRTSVQRLLAGMSYEFELDNKNSFKQIENKEVHDYSQDYDKNKNVKSTYSDQSQNELYLQYRKHPKEKLRVKRFEEINKNFEFKMDELDKEIHKILLSFDGNMDLSDNYTNEYLINILEETFYKARYYPIDEYTPQVISDLIEFDKQNISDFNFSSEESNSEFERDYESCSDEEKIRDFDTKIKETNNNKNISGGTSIIQNDKNSDTGDLNKSKLTINIPVFQKKEKDFNKFNEKQNTFKNIFTENKDNYSLLINSFDTEILSADNWRNILEDISLEIYRDYIFQEMKRIIGENDQMALETITDFLINNLNSDCNIQDTIDILKQILDKETEPFLKGLFMKIVEN